jgi:hypothetical protein
MPRMLPIRLFVIAGCLAGAAVGHFQHRAQLPVAPWSGTMEITAADRAAPLRFDPGVAFGDRAWIEQAIAGARPEARQLIAEVDGFVAVHTAQASAMPVPPGADGHAAMGVVRPRLSGFEMTFNISELDGERAIDREATVLHEFGHVVDFVLIPQPLDDQLDAGIPKPTSCGATGALYGACAPEEERFADTFAKWALKGAVSQVGAGYGIPTPPSLEGWGEPLVRLAAGLGKP